MANALQLVQSLLTAAATLRGLTVLGSPLTITAWKATAIPSQPVQSCGWASARLLESTVSAPVAATCTWARWICAPSAVGDALTTLSGPPALAGTASPTVKGTINTAKRRMPLGLPRPSRSKTVASARREGRFLEHLAQAAPDVVGRDAGVAEGANGAPVLVAQQREQDVLAAEMAVAEALGLAQRLLERGPRLLGDRHPAPLRRAGRGGGQAEAQDRVAGRVELDADGVQRRGGRSLRVGHQAEQHVARVDGGVLERPGRGAGGTDRATRLGGHDDALGRRRLGGIAGLRRRPVEALGVAAVGRLLGHAERLGDLRPRRAAGDGAAHRVDLELVELGAQRADRLEPVVRVGGAYGAGGERRRMLGLRGHDERIPRWGGRSSADVDADVFVAAESACL